jgi:predicted dehydrogenase
MLGQFARPATENALPRLGFAGVGWIGRHRLQALSEAGLCTPVAIAEPQAENAAAALEISPALELAEDFEALVARDDLDGVVIATPSAAHASQSIHALAHGLPVFCQKPLGRTAAEVSAVVEAARRADRLLGVDLSYRHTKAMQVIRNAVQGGSIGEVFAVDLVFHNAYGPDKPWFYDKAQSGGGCVIDLGVHLVDMALWVLGFPQMEHVESALYAGGRRVAGSGEVEDFAAATVGLVNGVSMRLTCSWKLHAGQDAEIAARFYGTEGGMELRNLNGSFYDFTARALVGTTATELAGPPDDWGGGAIRAWAARLRQTPAFDTDASELLQVAQVLDAIYAAAR